MDPRDCLGCLDVLARGEWTACHAVHKNLDARSLMRRRKPHVVGSALIAERGRDRAMHSESRIGECQSELCQCALPFVTAMRHRHEARDAQVTSSIFSVGSRRNSRSIGCPHRRCGQGIGKQSRRRRFGSTSERCQPGTIRPTLWQKDSLGQPKRDVGTHLGNALQCGGARLSGATGIFCRRQIPKAQPGIIVTGADQSVEIDLNDCHFTTARHE